MSQQKHQQFAPPPSAMQQEIMDAVAKAQAPIMKELAKIQSTVDQLKVEREGTFVTVGEAAAILKIHPKTVRRKCNDGEFEIKRSNRKILILRSSLKSI